MIGEQIYHGFSRSQVHKEGEDRARVLRISVQVGQQKISVYFQIIEGLSYCRWRLGVFQRVLSDDLPLNIAVKEVTKQVGQNILCKKTANIFSLFLADNKQGGGHYAPAESSKSGKVLWRLQRGPQHPGHRHGAVPDVARHLHKRGLFKEASALGGRGRCRRRDSEGTRLLARK